METLDPLRPFSPGPFQSRRVERSGGALAIYDAAGNLIGSSIATGQPPYYYVSGNAYLFAASWQLLHACQVVKRFLDRLEEAQAHSADPMDHAMRDSRRRIHAPLNHALDVALAEALPNLKPRERF